MKEDGIFLEIGKRGIWTREQVKEIKPKLNYHIIALDQLSVEKPEYVNSIMNEVISEFNSGVLKPIAVKKFPIHEVKAAFRFMAQGKHTGKSFFDGGRMGKGKKVISSRNRTPPLRLGPRQAT